MALGVRPEEEFPLSTSKLEAFGFPPPTPSGDLDLGRVLRIERRRHLVALEVGLRWSTAAGHLSGETDGLAVGDWVDVREEAQTVRVHPRRTWLARRRPGRGRNAQLVAANLDRVFIVTAIGADFSRRRIERFITLVRTGGAAPVVVVNKTDLPFDLPRTLGALGEAAPGLPLCLVSSATGDLRDLDSHLIPRETVALVGSSGVGKSSLVNALAGRGAQATQSVRSRDDKGRHTTTRRELVSLPSGALLIDTPGMREVGLDAEADVEAAFSDIAELAQSCRFANCRHEGEPGCAVREARASGAISEDRWRSHQKLLREAAFEAERARSGPAYDTKRRWKKVHQDLKERMKLDPKFRR